MILFSLFIKEKQNKIRMLSWCNQPSSVFSFYSSYYWFGTTILQNCKSHFISSLECLVILSTSLYNFNITFTYCSLSPNYFYTFVYIRQLICTQTIECNFSSMTVWHPGSFVKGLESCFKSGFSFILWSGCCFFPRHQFEKEDISCNVSPYSESNLHSTTPFYPLVLLLALIGRYCTMWPCLTISFPITSSNLHCMHKSLHHVWRD